MAKKFITVTITVSTKHEIAHLLQIIDPRTNPVLFDKLFVAWRKACCRENKRWLAARKRRRKARKRSAA